MDSEVAVLERWVASGGLWVVEGRSGDRITIALLTCDGGTEVDRMVTDDPGVREYLAGRERSD